MTKVSIEIKEGHKTISKITGRKVTNNPSLEKIIELERELERLTGYRFHINAEPLD